MTNEEAIAYFKECNERLVSVAKDENVYDYEKQVIEADCMRRTFEANEKVIKALEQTRWIPCSERLPEDGTWNIWQSKTGALSIERYKEDAYNHFYPSGRFFSLEDAVAWMPLPQPYKESEDSK